MFLCQEKCSKRCRIGGHMSGSYGRCEVCGQTAMCDDCPPSHGKLKPKPRSKKSAKRPLK